MKTYLFLMAFAGISAVCSAKPAGVEAALEWYPEIYGPYAELKRGEKTTAAQAAEMMEMAVESGEPLWVKMALECGADPNGRCTGSIDPQSEGRTYLYRAIFGGECHYGDSPGTARVLLEAGADPNLTSADGKVPLQCWRCMEEQISVLLDFGADPRLAATMPTQQNERNEIFARPLFLRASSEDFARLLAAGADPQQRGRDGRSSLMHAKTGEAVRLLLQAGVPWGVRDSQGRTALWYALDGCHTSAVQALLEEVPAAEQAYVRELLQARFAYVLVNSPKPQLVALLLEKGVSPTAATDADLVTAAVCGRLASVEMLQQRGRVFTPAMAQEVLCRGLLYTGTREEVFSFALRHGADVNACNAAGQNPAMAALAKPHHPNLNPAHLRQLLAAGLNLKYRDPKGRSLADYARLAQRRRTSPSSDLKLVQAILEKAEKRE